MSDERDRYRQSRALSERAHRVIPGGAHTYSKGDDQFPELAPGFLVRGEGARVWDADGNAFLDWGMGLRSVVLGYGHPGVLAAVQEHLARGANFTRPTPIEVELAEDLVRLIPCAEMVKFAKNGSDVTSAAVRLARAFTGRDVIARCADHPFFSFYDWFIGSTVVPDGVPEPVRALTKTFRYNDVASLERLFAEHPGKIAAVILEAATTEPPAPGFLERVRALATQHGAVLIFDEVITGFRWAVGGAQSYFGVTPDLATFGKAMGNGFSVAALVGKREIMERGGLNHDHPRVFLLSSTNGAETHALAAARATIAVLAAPGSIERLWSTGRALQDGINAAAREAGLAAQVSCSGYPCSPVLTCRDAAGQVSLPLRTLVLQEMIRHGVLFPYIAVSLAHGEREVELTLAAMRHALVTYARALTEGVDAHLVGPPVKPVFRRFNADRG